MKTGVILYFTGVTEPDVDRYSEAELKRIIPGADRIALVGKTIGMADIHEAMHRLLARGVHRIVCRTAEWTDAGGFQIRQPEVRLYG